MPEQPTSQPSKSLAADGGHVLRGLCMGIADVIPGVSGGTVALILGIYARLVTAISHVDHHMWHHLRRRDWRALSEHLDLRFLICLGSGIVTGVVGMTLVINRLLNHETTRAITLAVFFGMIFASAILVASMIETVTPKQTRRCVLLGVVGAVFAYWVSTLQNADPTTAPSYAFIFLCGCIAICAMILPGISGAMLLLVLGIYEHLTEVPHNLLAGKDIGGGLLTIAVFGSGCLLSLILFSKFLRWLLSRHYATTMALLCGFMFGALRKLWPFQRDLSPEVAKFKEKKFDVAWPEQFDRDTVVVIFAAILAAGLVVLIDRYSGRHSADDAG